METPGLKDFFSSSRLMLRVTTLQRATPVTKNVWRLATANFVFWNGFKVEFTTRCWLPNENIVSGICSSVSERMHRSHCPRNLYLILRMKNAIRVCCSGSTLRFMDTGRREGDFETRTRRKGLPRDLTASFVCFFVLLACAR